MAQLLRLFLVLSLSAPVFAACGDDDDDDDDVGADGDADADADGDGDACADPQPCDVYAQCGCDEGENCTFVNDVKACDQAGTGAQDDDCDQANPCSAGFVCLSDNTCAAFCRTNGECPNGAACNISLQAAGAQPGDPPLATACSTPDNCDALEQDCETVGYACYITNPNDGTTDCAPEGDQAPGTDCENTNACRAGATCINLGGAGFSCLPHCDSTADPSTCEGGATCQSVTNDGPLGVCVPAAD
jgi:hypothetical protein